MNGSGFEVLLFFSTIIFLADIRFSAESSVLLRAVSKDLGSDLEALKNGELGSEYIKKLYSSFKYRPTIVDANETLNEMADKLEEKIVDIFAALSHAKAAVESMQMLENTTNTRSALIPCVDDFENVKNLNVCGNLIDVILDKSSKEVDYLLQKLKTKSWNVKNAIKQQYLISSFDVESFDTSPFLHCNGQDHMLLWSSYMSRNRYVPRKVVLLLDHGGSLSKQHFFIVKSVAKEMVSALNEADSVAILAISNDWASPELSDECLMPNQVPSILSDIDVTPKFFQVDKTRKRLIHKFIDGLKKGSGATNHSLGLTKALKVVEMNRQQNETVMVLYISRGLLSSLTEAKTVLETILERSRKIDSRLIINTCAVIDESRPTIYETQFLRDIAIQDYQKYNITNRIGPGGTMVAVNSSEMVGFAVSHFYNVYKSGTYDLEPRISTPTWDSKANDLSVSFSIGSLVNDQFSLLGVDILFENWAENFLYFCGSHRHHYAFLMDLQGKVLMHPSFSCPTTVKQQLNYVDISHFERVPGFEIFRTRLLEEPQGVHIIAQPSFTRKYTWKRVGEWYVMCVVIRDIHTTSVRPFQVYWPLNSSDDYNLKLIYQDLEGEKPELCRHLDQVASLDAGSLYLSASCFQTPQKQQSFQNYMAYIQDNSHVLSNPGLKGEIKDEVAVLAYILTYLRNRHLSSLESRYIVRRYAASYGGVLEMFPGSLIDDGLDPTKRPWFLQATEHKNRVIMTPPYLDEGGAGYIVTVAYATTYAVVAIDVTYGYIFRMLLKRMPLCSSANITCFLMDDRGYLVYHPNLIDPNGHGPVEKQHIVHKESLVANDILSHSHFIQKRLCNSYGGGTVQRFYKLNTSFSDVLINSVQGESCIGYHIAAIPSSNVFVGMVNATCNIVVTFCPCSIVDRLCLNCNRMEQKECECPCECPLESSKCGGTLDNPICPWFPEQVSYAAHFYEKARNGLKSCFPATCGLEKTHLGCLGVTGCEWCKFDVDGALLSNPFCASLATCFNGIVGSVTPYRNSDDSSKSLSVPVSFIVLFILGVLVVLCMFYFYHRSTNPPVSERLYLSSTQDNHLRMSDLNLSDNFHATGSHRDKLLQEEKPDPVSPYCVSSGYRRIAMAADSDHGYSTMTQHDESERMSLAPVELESLEDGIGSADANTNTISKSPQLLMSEFTCVPNRNNRIVVPVTVHRNMETT